MKPCLVQLRPGKESEEKKKRSGKIDIFQLKETSRRGKRDPKGSWRVNDRRIGTVSKKNEYI